ncbi:antitoxin HicB [Rathayibacter rathayi]|uniref:antitoxin HicB n=1 Tax=Rathayibacter rathayi TaxID=33887 RepID=UPI000CE73B84|nr:antitoxin HicB [Rathayibacter rathayi]PPG67752.1 antitoxin HicB [Rathayibacter rathayi]PPG75575.1 antitoxin HicB [Rathayibacter rathayi]PPH18484.1 antitoxin HicB [Rathayibacter rathayi]PPI75528.1 antitoxin HicB [Rathayibacter rathayi]
MNITVTAHHWEHGWELWIDGEAATQVATLDKAVQQVRDYFDTVDPSVDHGEWDVTVVPEIGSLGVEIIEARRATAEAVQASAAAAARARVAARRLREAGYSVTDSAAILGVSRGRVSQLTGSSTRSRATIGT